jgi:hypothetical protein
VGLAEEGEEGLNKKIKTLLITILTNLVLASYTAFTIDFVPVR